MSKLHPELKKYVERGGIFPMLRHPLVYSVPFFDGDEERCNKQYQYKMEALEEAIQTRSVHSYIFLHERPFRLIALCKALSFKWGFESDPTQYWDVLADVWVDSEYPHLNKDMWRMLFKKDLPEKWRFMDEEDRQHFESLPEKFTIYRGYSKTNRAKNGISWTTDKEVAEFFANRFKKKEDDGMIAKKVVTKDKVFGFTNRRNESEIIYIQ